LWANTVAANSLTPWIAIVASLSGLIVGLVTALWAYTKFILERGLLPPTQFWVECRALGCHTGQTPLEIVIHLHNIGSATLIATDIRLDIRYLTDADSLQPWLRAKPEALFGQLTFPWSLKAEMVKQSGRPAAPEPKHKEAPKATRGDEPPRGFSVMPHDSFVQAKVDQTYTFVTTVPESTRYLLVWAQFAYAQSPKPLPSLMLWISRRLGLIQFTLAHATKPHTTQSVFWLDGGKVGHPATAVEVSAEPASTARQSGHFAQSPVLHHDE
jgi:hypothetical protein